MAGLFTATNCVKVMLPFCGVILLERAVNLSLYSNQLLVGLLLCKQSSVYVDLGLLSWDICGCA